VNALNAITLDWTTVLVFVVSVLMFLLQLFLCFKVKKTVSKLVPLLLLLASTIVFSVLSARVGGWDGIGLLFFALFSFGLMFVCGIGWWIWLITKKQ